MAGGSVSSRSEPGVRITVLRADGTVKADLGYVTPPVGTHGLRRLAWRVWIRTKFVYFRARRRI